MRLVLIVIAAVAVAFAVSFVLSRRGVMVASVAILIGAGIAFLSAVVTGCSQCWTEALPVGAFVSAPFFIVGWIALAQAEIDRLQRRLVLGLALIMLVQLVWASRVSLFATLEGRCPCGPALVGILDTQMPAIGFDRLAGPWFLGEAVVTLAILIATLRRVAELPRA